MSNTLWTQHAVFIYLFIYYVTLIIFKGHEVEREQEDRKGDEGRGNTF